MASASQPAPLDLAHCESCGGYGWLLADDGESRNDVVIQRCDACERFPGDEDATRFLDAEVKRQRAEIERLQASEARLRAALTQVMSWIDNWSPTFTEDDEWAADEQAARAALSGQEGA